jgi:hypothetical protein
MKRITFALLFLVIAEITGCSAKRQGRVVVPPDQAAASNNPNWTIISEPAKADH